MHIDVFNGVEDTVKIKTGYKIRQKSRNHDEGTLFPMDTLGPQNQCLYHASF